MHVFFESVTIVFEVIGVVAMAVGFVVAVVLCLRTWVLTKSGHDAFITLRDTLGLAILLGLEVLVAADLVHTVTSTPSLTDAAVLAIVVLIRTILSFSLQVEIDGVVPWRRALLTAPQQIAGRARSARSQNAKEEPHDRPQPRRRRTRSGPGHANEVVAS